jgi:hypothetical protein
MGGRIPQIWVPSWIMNQLQAVVICWIGLQEEAGLAFVTGASFPYYTS